MRKHQLSAFLCIVLTLFVISCSKHNDSPSNGGGTGTDSTTKSTTPEDSITVNLDYEAALSPNFELIISEPGGKVLLDTLAAFNTSIKATLHTTQPLLDLTTIRKISDTNMTIYTYKGVSPAQWNNLELSTYYANPIEANNTPALITYINTPASLTSDPIIQFMFANPLNVSYSAGYSPNTLNIQYQMAAGEYDYLLFPTEGLYNLHIPTSARDTVDLSQMDTVTRLNYTFPAGYTYISTQLIGIQDTTNTAKSLQLANGLINYPSGTQLELPSMSFQKYAGVVAASLSSTEGATYLYYGNSVQLNIPFLTLGSYTLSSIDQNNVVPSFSTSPTRYMTNWSVNANITFNIYSSPDSAEHPAALIATIASQSKFLKGVSTSSLTLNFFSYYNTDDLNYATYCQKTSSYNSTTWQPTQKEISYTKTY
jgi:hypothetical protein